MSERLSFRDRWVVVTGASAGLGLAMARILGEEHHAKLLLVARRGERLSAVAKELEERGCPTAQVMALDLALPDAASRVFEEATRGREIYAVVSNAATYWFGSFDAMPEDDLERMLALNIRFPVALTRKFLPYLARRRSGGILLVSSLGGLIPSPGQTLYSSTKAALRSFVENLYFERGGKNGDVVLTASFPGGMLTDMLTASPAMEEVQKSWVVRRSLMDPGEVARASLEGFARGQLLLVPGRINRMFVGLARLLPRETVGLAAADTYGLRNGGRS